MSLERLESKFRELTERLRDLEQEHGKVVLQMIADKHQLRVGDKVRTQDSTTGAISYGTINRIKADKCHVVKEGETLAEAFDYLNVHKEVS